MALLTALLWGQNENLCPRAQACQQPATGMQQDCHLEVPFKPGEGWLEVEIQGDPQEGS